MDFFRQLLLLDGSCAWIDLEACGTGHPAFSIQALYCPDFIRMLPGESAGNLTAVFLSFSYSLCLLTDLYWLIYDLMRPESRMPFAASVSGMVWDSSLCFR